MAAFHVFVEGATDGSPTGLSRLADAIAKQYGLPAADLLARLQKGRFRVKGNIDRPTAETYVRDLEKLGARCTIEEATAATSQQKTPLPFPAVTPPATAARPSTPPPTTSALAGAAKPATPAASGQFQSGLSAAFSGETPAADLGALGREDAAFSLATVDGADDGKQAPSGSFEPPGGGLPASIGPAPDKPTTGNVAKAAKPKDEPLDMFAPPEMQGEEFKVDIADDEKDVSARKRASTPPPVDDAAGKPTSQKLPTVGTSQRIPTTPGRASQPSIEGAVVAPSSNRFGPLGEPRVRFAAGVLLAVILGFVPAHFVAAMREKSAFDAIDNKVIAAQQLAETPELYAALDPMRTDQLGRKESEHRNAAILGLALWALVGAGIAFVWFKKIPWED